MKQDSVEAQIYLANQRGLTELDWLRSWQVFNFGWYQVEGRQPFGNLQVLNDDTLQAGTRLRMQAEENTRVLILPLVGGIEYTDEMGGHAFVAAGQTLEVATPNSLSYEIANPYEEELINFLQIWIHQKTDAYRLTSQSFELSPGNQLVPISQDQLYYIGQYDGRAEGQYTLTDPAKGVFIFCIEGAFEMQNRLLESRDGLALKHADSIEFEALSSGAIVLIVEV
ncbi:pirin family protein [Siphonobacter curvatus]|uniref:Pirin n=1 Tax=Siphonobacter curvatus TaxID=2094562 RepID=A0A2S7IL30_9BACT|nr:pirin [Siphonobacter curvatus]PQA58434.1 pirin [Siphonobacter curvatus]